jgi:cold shock CspA family protein
MENNNFTQLCVWQGVVLDGFTIQEFENWMFDNFTTRIKYETEIKTLPDLDEKGNHISETGGRNDVFFFVHAEDISRFAVPRLQAGIRWWEDVVKYNNGSHLYPKEILDKYELTW